MQIAVVAGLVATIAIGLSWWRGSGRLKRGSRERIRPADVALPADAFGDRATLLLFMSQQCTRSPAVARMLDGVVTDTRGIRRADVDLTVHGDLAGRFAVLQTPTLFVLDADHRLTARLPGVPARALVLQALATAAPGTYDRSA